MLPGRVHFARNSSRICHDVPRLRSTKYKEERISQGEIIFRGMDKDTVAYFRVAMAVKTVSDPDQKFLKLPDALAFLLCVFAARADLRRRSG